MLWEPQNRARRILRWIWIYFLYCSGLILWARRCVAASGGVIVLTLHRVLDDASLSISDSPPGMIVRRQTFVALLQFLCERAEVIPLTDLPPSWEKGNARPRFAITFDDGWKETSDVAFPLMETFGVPITVFVCPGLVGKESPFWSEQVLSALRIALLSSDLRDKFARVCAEAGLRDLFASSSAANLDCYVLLERLKQSAARDRERIVQQLVALTAGSPSASVDATMTWGDTARIAEAGAQIGSHTQTHQILTTLPPAEIRAELTASKLGIEAALGRPCALFAYPNGSWSREARDLVLQAGYAQAFVNEVGVWTSGTDHLLIPRVNLWEGSVAGPSGHFSPVVFQYAAFWCGYRAEIRQRKKAR